ncbi:MAG: zinc-binding dehydrogenase, partial [Longimicrobiales bacterium]
CGTCRPCVDGYPNHCEKLQEIGFSVDGAFAEYVKVDAKYTWSLEELRKVYKGDDLFLAGSVSEPTSVAYNAVIERGGGIRPGDNVVILGGGPIGQAAVAVLKRAGAARVILSEPSEDRAELARKMGADFVINPMKEDFARRVLEITGGLGAKLYLEATGLPDKVWPGIEQCIWEGKMINSTVVIVARADKKIPLTGEVFQVRRAEIIGSQGRSGSTMKSWSRSSWSSSAWVPFASLRLFETPMCGSVWKGGRPPNRQSRRNARSSVGTSWAIPG